METIKQRDVSTAQDLIAAVRDRSVDRIVVSGDLAGLSSLELWPNPALTAAARATLQFKDDSDGIRLSSNNKLENLTLIAAPEKRAIFNDTTVTDLGCLELRNLTLTGAVQILAADRVRSGHVEAHNIDIVSADTRGYEARPKAYGVEVITGAFTIWNQQLEPSTAITADLTEISTGRPNSPVRGSGIFVSGAGETGGRLLVRRLETGVIHCDAGIAHGTPDRISAGVFTSYGAIVDLVRTRGRVTTYGPNDMALDNWGVVDRWISEEKITTYGPSGIGFVNFGAINSLTLNGPIETFGQGARGFNVYSGTLKFAEFDRIVTRGNGAVGIQISQPVGEISVRRGIETFGGSGESLVKGVMTNLPAIAFSVKAGGAVRALTVAGGLTTHGSAVAPLDVEGSVESLFLKGGVTTSGG
jgi:hypothetical protein